jgi:hypothetical protein
MNEYELNYKYFEDVIKREFGHGLSNYRPDEFARVCLRMARTASHETFTESEFINRPYEDKIKADAVREARISCAQYSTFEPYGATAIVMGKDLMDYASKLERGEL